MPKNIVICFDGTGEEYGDNNSNVVELYSFLENSSSQVTFYHPGLGTMGSKFAVSKLGRWWTKLLGLAFGYGLTDNISSGYEFLMNRYEPGDRVYLFGFSRGAYTVRALAAMLHMFGLLRKGNDVLVPYAIRQFESRIRDDHTFVVASGFKATFSSECKPYFLGVWDTVSSVGWIYDPLHLPYTAHNPDIAICRHAVSIDERRCEFRQNLWQPAPGQDSKQLWFAGTHSDVGGGYAKSESGLSNITLRWMISEAIGAGLRVNDAGHAALNTSLSHLDPCAPTHESLKWYWWPLEFLPKRYVDMRCMPPRRRWYFPLGRRRWMLDGSILDCSVKSRMEAGYHPSNLPTIYKIDCSQEPLAPRTTSATDSGA